MVKNLWPIARLLLQDCISLSTDTAVQIYSLVTSELLRSIFSVALEVSDSQALAQSDECDVQFGGVVEILVALFRHIGMLIELDEVELSRRHSSYCFGSVGYC